MSKDFSLRLTEQDMVVLMSKYGSWTVSPAAPPVGGYVPLPTSKPEVVAEILDIVSAADVQPNFDTAKRVVEERSRKLCEKSRLPVSAVIEYGAQRRLMFNAEGSRFPI